MTKKHNRSNSTPASSANISSDNDSHELLKFRIDVINNIISEVDQLLPSMAVMYAQRVQSIQDEKDAHALITWTTELNEIVARCRALIWTISTRVEIQRSYAQSSGSASENVGYMEGVESYMDGVDRFHSDLTLILELLGRLGLNAS
ncbi:hypothetical protein BGZ83_009903 [Gryganskiella cystojenkinii]|nr:hypothetical protein BGZ83_009903 [Gryganskiella cystojenkinii]